MTATAQVDQVRLPGIADALPRHRAYKPASVRFLGHTPEHWTEKRAKYFFREVDERSTTGKETLLSVSHLTGVTPRSQKNVTMFMAESTVGYKLCRPGDLAINTMWAWMGAMGVSREVGLISPAYGVYRPTSGSLLPEYVDRLLRTPGYVAEYVCRSTGIQSSRLRLYPEEFLRIPLLCPPLDEQRAIIRFLDNVDHRVGRYIRAKQKLIKLLEEQKLAIIHQAVTRGLDPKVRLKASGVQWIGDIPEHWAVAPLRLRYLVQLGKMLDSKRISGRYLMPYLRNTDVQWGRVNVASLPMMDIAPEELERYTVRPGDLLVCEGGEVGRAAIWEGDAPVGFQKALHRLRPLDAQKDSSSYLFYVLQDTAKRGVFRADGSENTIAHLTCEKLRRHRFAFPALSEQRLIVSHLNVRLEVFRRALERARGQIINVQEFRTRLTAAVVTGKLDVRAAADSLPEEPGEPLRDIALEDEAVEDGEDDFSPEETDE